MTVMEMRWSFSFHAWWKRRIAPLSARVLTLPDGRTRVIINWEQPIIYILFPLHKSYTLVLLSHKNWNACWANRHLFSSKAAYHGPFQHLVELLSNKSVRATRADTKCAETLQNKFLSPKQEIILFWIREQMLRDAEENPEGNKLRHKEALK